MTIHNPELARQHARILAVRERIRARAVPDTGIDLRRDRARAALREVARPPRGRDLREQHVDHVRAWRRVERARLPTGPAFRDVVATTCAAWGALVEDVLGLRQTNDVVRPRRATMYLCRELTRVSLSEIGRRFGRDHATVIAACDAVARLVARGDAETLELVAEVRRRLGLDDRAGLS